MRVKFFNNLEYQTYPITHDMIEVDERLLNEIGKTKQFINGQIVDYVPPIDNSKEIGVKKARLTELTKDLAQVQAGLIVPNIEEKKAEFRTLLNEIRVLQGKFPREIVGG